MFVSNQLQKQCKQNQRKATAVFFSANISFMAPELYELYRRGIVDSRGFAREGYTEVWDGTTVYLMKDADYAAMMAKAKTSKAKAAKASVTADDVTIEQPGQ